MNIKETFTRCLNHFAEMKHPDNGDWIVCVIYMDKVSRQTYVREVSDFRNKLRLVGK